MNILIICNGWPSDILGGGESHIVNVSRYWSKKANVYFIAPDTFKKILSDKGLNVIPYRDVLRGCGEPPMLYFRYISRILLSLKLMLKYDFKADYVVSTTNHLYDIIPAILYGLIRGAKVIFYVHSIINIRLQYGLVDFLRSLIAYITQFLGLLIGKVCSDKIFVINPLIRKFVGEKSYITWNGVEEVKVSKPPRKIWDFCYIGRLDRTKDVDVLLKAWRISEKRDLKMRLILIGRGELYNSIREMIERGEVKNIYLTGPLYGFRKYDVIIKSRFLINLSRSESFSTVILEALAMGIPVIARRLPILEALYGDMLIYIDDISPEELAEYLAEIIRDHREIARKILSNSKLLSRKYSWKNIALYELKVILNEKK